MSNKFSIGDKVVINRKCNRLPLWIRNGLRLDRKRIITAIFYDKKTQHTRYYLGMNRKSDIGEDIYSYAFRAEMLKMYKMKLSTRKLKARKTQICLSAMV